MLLRPPVRGTLAPPAGAQPSARHIIRCLISEHPPRIVVHPVFYPLYLGACIFPYVRTFRDESSYQSVCVFVASSLPRTVRVCIIAYRPFLALVQHRALQSFHIQKLAAVVHCNTLEYFLELAPMLPLQSVQHRLDVLLRLPGHLEDQLLSALSLCQHQQARTTRQTHEWAK